MQLSEALMGLSQKKKIIGIVVLLISAFYVENKLNTHEKTEQIERLFNSRISGKMVTFDATVLKLLKDDLKGDKHQKLILKTRNKTLLLAHNVDIAPRVPVKKGTAC
ncbi:MAG: DUF3465 domain-containing protein [Proteobacteria bacterium]|nr:DUF3465 domain-containing protein [Pseudomonadota bacterium]